MQSVSILSLYYDALGCPQQKCLIHLIRYMNEDLKANPYDVELRVIVQAFATMCDLLLRQWIGTG